MFHLPGSLVLAGTWLAFAGAASSQVFTISMTQDQVVPPTPSTASGQGSLRLDASNMLSFEITLTGLHGTETEASLHGPAPMGADTEILFDLPLGNAKTGRLGPLAPQQLTDLAAGLWYVTIHSSHNGNGEIRGQIRGPLVVEAHTWEQLKNQYRTR